MMVTDQRRTQPATAEPPVAPSLSDPWVASWTAEGGWASGRATATSALSRRFSTLRWMLIAGVLAMGIGSNELSNPADVAAGSETTGLSGSAASPASLATATTGTTAAATTTTTTTEPPAARSATTVVGALPPPPDPGPTADSLTLDPPYVVATSSAPVAVHDGPHPDSPRRVLDPAAELSGQLVFLVKQETPDWLEVYLPIRPNGSTGWLRPGDVALYEHDYRIELSLSQRRLVLFEGDGVILDEPIGIGTDRTPTPGGIYYLKELLRPPDPAGSYGPYAYGLSGFSNVLTDFAGGDGVLGLHGTNDPSSVGRTASNGCIRLHNATITRLVEDIGLPLGTPVVVRA